VICFIVREILSSFSKLVEPLLIYIYRKKERRKEGKKNFGCVKELGK
jgi:hypothetical protein